MNSTIAYDLDGTLVNTLPSIAQSHIWYFHEVHGLNLTERELEGLGCFSLGFFDYLNAVATKFSIQVDAHDFVEKVMEVQMESIRVNINVDEANMHLESTRQQGHCVMVVTSSHRLRAQRIIDITKLDIAPNMMITADDVPRGKTKPDSYPFELAFLGSSDLRVAVGDSLEDVIAGKNASGLPILFTGHSDRACRFVSSETTVIRSYPFLTQYLGDLVQPQVTYFT